MKYKVLFLLIIVIMFNGLINSRELNELAIVSAMGVDLDEEGNYIVSAQILNTKKSGNSSSGSSSSDGAIVTVYTKKGSSIQEAIREMITESSNRLYLAHMELLILSEKIAYEKNIMDTLDFFIRDNEGSSNFILTISKETEPLEILKTLTPIQTIPVESITKNIISTEKYKGAAVDKLLMEDIEVVLTKGKEMVITSISLEGKKDALENEEGLLATDVKTKIVVDDLAYFKKNRLKGYLQDNDNMIYNLLENNIQNAKITIGNGENRVFAEIIESKASLEPKKENDVYKLLVNIKVSCNITESGKNISTNKKQELEKIKNDIKEKLKQEIETFIYNTQNVYESDIIGIENIFYKHLNKEYKKIENSFSEEYFKHIKPQVNVDVKLPNEGGLIKKW